MKKEMLIFFVDGSLKLASDGEKINALAEQLKEKQHSKDLFDVTPYLPDKKHETDKIKIRPGEINAIVITDPQQNKIFRPAGGGN